MASAKHNWLIALSMLFFSFSGVILALICIYSLPGRISQPLTGAYFFWGGAMVLSVFLIVHWKKQKVIENDLLKQNSEKNLERILIKETLSDKIIKWLVTIFSFFFVFDGIAIALICIYALPDKTSHPLVGSYYFMGSAIVVASFIYQIFKTLMLNKS